MMIAILSPTLGGGASAPGWLPDGATAFLDFVNGSYYAGGGVHDVGDLLGDGPDTVAAGGGFDAGAITGDGMYMDNIETNRPNAIGALFDDLKAGLAAGCTVVMEIDFRSSPYGSFIWLLSGIDNSFGNFIAGAYVLGDVEVDDPDEVGLAGGNSAFSDDPGIKRLAVTFSRHTGGNYEYAVSSEGAAATTQTVAYAPSTDVNNITLFHDGADSSILDDAYVRTVTLYPALDPADLPALTA